MLLRKYVSVLFNEQAFDSLSEATYDSVRIRPFLEGLSGVVSEIIPCEAFEVEQTPFL